MGLSLFLLFVFCNFTESNRRGRRAGFPSRLFTLPVPTRTLIAAPVLFGVAAVVLLYAAWAKFVLPPLGRALPLGWPSLYLATGMVIYHCVLWSLAGFRVARILTLGIGGTVLAIGWVAFRSDADRWMVSLWLPIGDDFPVRPALCAILVAMSAAAFLMACVAVESERRGGIKEWSGARLLIERVVDAIPRRPLFFRSPRRAQFWFEWRRHGMLLPLATTGVLTLIMAPGFFFGPIGEEATTLGLSWILISPLLLAFALGKGFGKADLWSKDAGLPIFLATRPLPNTAWIGAKMQAAAVAAAASWVPVILLTPLWLVWCCDDAGLRELWWIAGRLYPAGKLFAAPALMLGVLVILTWRLLTVSLYLGLSGKPWMIPAAACGVFTAILGTPFALLALTLHPAAARRLLILPVWIPWLLAGLFAAKVGAAFFLAAGAHRRGWITSRSIQRYLLVWLAGTSYLLAVVWLLVPIEGWGKWFFLLLALFVLPMVRIAYAPIALENNRRR